MLGKVEVIVLRVGTRRLVLEEKQSKLMVNIWMSLTTSEIHTPFDHLRRGAPYRSKVDDRKIRFLRFAAVPFLASTHEAKVPGNNRSRESLHKATIGLARHFRERKLGRLMLIANAN